MVKNTIKKTLQKRGIAMIELIFSIVIMGIVLLSAPMLIQQSISSGNVALQQEAIVAAASQTSIILSMHWDENDNNNSAVSPMLDVNRVPFDFNDTVPPLGLVDVTGRQSTNAAGNTLPAVAEVDFGANLDQTGDGNMEVDFTDFDDVDDYNGSEFNITVFNSEVTTSDVGDYVDTTIKMNTTINYAEDRPSGDLNSSHIIITPTGDVSRISSNSPAGNPITNIKFIRVNLTSESGVAELEKNIIFEAFSCNIGTTLPQGKEY